MTWSVFDRPPVVLYSLGRIPEEPGLIPVMQQKMIPTVCVEHRCSLRIVSDANDATVEHVSYEMIERYPISADRLVDVNYDIWADAAQWIEGLHRQEQQP